MNDLAEREPAWPNWSQNDPSPPSRPRSATTVSQASRTRRSEGYEASSTATIQERRASRAARFPSAEIAVATVLPPRASFSGAAATPTAPSRSSTSTESTADSFRSRSMTISTNQTSVYSSPRPSFDQITKSGKTAHPRRPSASSSSQRYAFPMPPASSTPASPLHNNSILWPTHSPIKASAMSTSKSTYSLHDEPESISPDDVSTSQQTRSSSQHQHSAGSSGSSTGSGWRAIARKASGRFRRSFSSSGSLVNVAQEAQYHPMPAMPAMPAAYSSKSDLVGDSDPPSPPVSSTSSSGFIGNILSRKKSRDSLNTSSGSEGSSGRRPRPPWNDLPPSPQLPQQQSHKLYSSQSSNGSTLSFKLGRSGKQRLDHVQVTPFEVKPSLSLERSSTDNGLLSPGPARIAPRRASTDVSVASKTPKPSGVPRSASAQYFVQQRPASIGSTMPGMARSNSSSGNSPPPVFLDEDMPPVPPLPQDVKKDPITFSHSTSSTVSSSNPSSRSISESSNHLSQSCQSPRISSRPPPIVQPPKVSLDCSEETSEPLTPHAIDQPAASTATLPERIRFPAAFGFVPRPDTADGPDSVFGADASAACIPTPYGHLRAANSDISLSSAISSEADRSGQSSAASSATSLQPPKRTNSLSPLSRSEAPPLPRRNKALEFEELLASDIGTMKISLGQSKR